MRCFIVESRGAAVLAGKAVTRAQHPIQGGGCARRILPILRPELPDGFLSVSGEEAREMAQRLVDTEGLFAGYSSGANPAAAVQLLSAEFNGEAATEMFA